MSIILGIGTFNALFFLVLLIQKRDKSFSDKILMYWLIYLAFFIGTYAIVFRHSSSVNQLVYSGFISLFLIHGPFLYIYSLSLIKSEKSTGYLSILHFVPFICFILYLCISIYWPDYSARISLDHVSSEIAPPFLFVLFLIFTAISGPTYFILTVSLLGSFRRVILNNFSNADRMGVLWLRNLVLIFGIVWTILVVVIIVHHAFHLFSRVFCTDGLFLSLSIFVVLIGYFGLKQKEIFIQNVNGPEKQVVSSKPKYAGFNIDEKIEHEYIERLTNYMDKMKPYLNFDLTLPQLSGELDIPSHHLSRIINEKFSSTFFEFINLYRVQDVKKKIIDPEYDNYSLLGIAYDCGFNSKSAFNRVFKKITGLTPSEYKRTHKIN